MQKSNLVTILYPKNQNQPQLKHHPHQQTHNLMQLTTENNTLSYFKTYVDITDYYNIPPLLHLFMTGTIGDFRDYHL